MLCIVITTEFKKTEVLFVVCPSFVLLIWKVVQLVIDGITHSLKEESYSLGVLLLSETRLASVMRNVFCRLQLIHRIQPFPEEASSN